MRSIPVNRLRSTEYGNVQIMDKATLRARLAGNLAKYIGPVWNSTNEAGVQTGVGRTTIDHILKETRGVTIDTVDRIAEKLGIDPVSLLSPDSNPPQHPTVGDEWMGKACALLGELPDEERQAFLIAVEHAVQSNRAQWTRLAKVYGDANRGDT